MIAATYGLLALVAVIACAFVAVPILKTQTTRGGAVLAAAAALFVFGLGGALYLQFGHPELAARTLEGTQARDLNALIGRLAEVVRGRPQDPRGWTILGRAYLTAGDPGDAAKAFARAITAQRLSGEAVQSILYSAYGEALTQDAAGAVTPEAEAAFSQALASDPRDRAARYYLGLAAAARDDKHKALTLWQSLLADVPPASAVHEDLVDRIAALTAQSGGVPDVRAMVAGLAARLKAQPNDAAGWQRLIRAYAVLGEKDEARQALADARTALAAQPDQIAALDMEQKSLGL